MKKTFAVLGALGLVIAVHGAKADTVVVVANGNGGISGSTLSFTDANGTAVVLNGIANTASFTYSDGATASFPYSQTISGNSVTGTFNGANEQGYAYTATVSETLITKTVNSGGSGRGGGYRPPQRVTIVSSGSISYDYAIAPLVASTLSSPSVTQNSASLSWTPAAGGTAPYSYSVIQDGVDVMDTTGTTATINGLYPSSAYSFTIVTTDAAGHSISSLSITATTNAATLNTVYTYNSRTHSVSVKWTADPTAVKYSVFYYDYYAGQWVDGADTTGTKATITGWNPNNATLDFYTASYDANGVETDYDAQTVWVTTHHTVDD